MYVTIPLILASTSHKPTAQFPPALAQAGLQLGLKLFDSIRWEQVRGLEEGWLLLL